MANKQYINNHDNIHPNDGSTFHSIWVCPTYADRPVTGLIVGDLMIVMNESTIYIADSATTWVGGVNLGQIKVPSLYVGSFAELMYHLVVSNATSPQLIAIPDGGGAFVTEDYAQPLDNKTRLVVNTSGTGVCRIEELTGLANYVAIGLAGLVGPTTYNFASSPGDTNLYVSRPAGKSIIFNGTTGQDMILGPNGALIGSMDTMTYGATIALDVTLGNTHKTTLTGNATINASAVGSADQHMTIILVNDATLARTVTFGTNFRSAGVVVGTISKVAIVKFVSDGTAWFEESRTLVL